MAGEERFLVTGALGCIGSWTVAQLVSEDVAVTVYDLGDNPYRLRYLLDEEQLSVVKFVQGDVTDLDTLEKVVGDNGITHIVHLAALQVPFCRADPPLGARVNVVGTVNVFEVAKQHRDHVRQVVYASSSAVYGPQSAYESSPVPPEARLLPATHYGVYKQANEGTAAIYWQDDGIPSITLRPYIVYGVGRDQGGTSGASKAMLAAAAGRPFHIPHGGGADYHLARDVARVFIGCARTPVEGATAHNLPSDPSSVEDIVAAIEAEVPDAKGKITFDKDTILPFPDSLDGSSLEAVLGEVEMTPLRDGIKETVGHYRKLIESDAIDIDRGLSEP